MTSQSTAGLNLLIYLSGRRFIPALNDRVFTPSAEIKTEKTLHDLRLEKQTLLGKKAIFVRSKFSAKQKSPS
jgi:hypothetical protein